MPKTEKSYICKFCGKEFYVLSYNLTYSSGTIKPPQFCSRKCSARSRPVRAEYGAKFCEGCGRLFWGSTGDKHFQRQRYCSNYCHTYVGVKRSEKMPMGWRKKYIKVCRNCGEALGNRGNSYDFCRKCLPSKSMRVNYCVECKRVIPSKITICDGCLPIHNRKKSNKIKSLAKEYKDKLRLSGCIVCGYSGCVDALEFHHLSGKSDTISKLSTISRIKHEINLYPVVVLCANHHREYHAGLISKESLLPYRLKTENQQLKIFNISDYAKK